MPQFNNGSDLSYGLRAMRKYLVTSTVSKGTYMTNDPHCFICGGEEESWVHILCDCPAAKVVWTKLEGLSIDQSFWQENIKEWIASNLKDKADEKEER